MKKKLSAFFMAVMMLITPIFFTEPAYATETITKTLDIAGLNKNGSGAGYTWANIDGILTLDNLKIDTDDDYGLTLPENATIVLNGDNYIKADYCAIRAVASLTIQGNGTLTLISNDTGIFCGSNIERDVVRFRSGKITITSETGVYAEYATLAFAGSDVTINAGTYALRGKNIQGSGGSITSNGKISSGNDLSLKGINLNATAQAPVLSAKNKLEISSCDIFCGENQDNLSQTEKYTDTASVKLISTVDKSLKGVLFGGKFPLFVDYIIFISLGLIAAAVIAIPLYIKSKKTQKLLAAHQKMLDRKKNKKK